MAPGPLGPRGLSPPLNLDLTKKAILPPWQNFSASPESKRGPLTFFQPYPPPLFGESPGATATHLRLPNISSPISRIHLQLQVGHVWVKAQCWGRGWRFAGGWWWGFAAKLLIQTRLTHENEFHGLESSRKRAEHWSESEATEMRWCR